MIQFNYRGFTGQGELLEETNTSYVIGFEDDQRTYPKELTTIEELTAPVSFELEPYETLVYKSNIPHALHYETVKGQIRKNGKIAVYRKLEN